MNPPVRCATYAHTVITPPLPYYNYYLMVDIDNGEYRQTEYEYFHYVALLFFNISSWKFDKIAQTDIIWSSETFIFNGITLSKIEQHFTGIYWHHIPVNILKDAIDTYLPILTKIFNSSIEQNEFPNELKLADVLPIYKKKILLIKKIIDL